jgi:putative FmdB family regulatory protein
MPLYEYECDACGRRFEVIQKMSDPVVEICPTCGGRVHKLQSAPAFQFKGSGWYVTDYARKDQPAAAKDEGDSKPTKAGDKGEKAAEGTKNAPTTESSSTSTSSADSSTPKTT